jgi:uncharacterized protein (DUF2249 family)
MSSNSNLYEQPAWFSTSEISDTLDAREILQAGQHPLAEVLMRTSLLQTGQIFKLITPFAPMPLIEKVKNQDCEAFVQKINDTEIYTYFCKK